MTKQLCVCPQLSSTSSWLGAGNVLHVLCAAKSTQASLPPVDLAAQSIMKYIACVC